MLDWVRSEMNSVSSTDLGMIGGFVRGRYAGSIRSVHVAISTGSTVGLKSQLTTLFFEVEEERASLEDVAELCTALMGLMATSPCFGAQQDESVFWNERRWVQFLRKNPRTEALHRIYEALVSTIPSDSEGEKLEFPASGDGHRRLVDRVKTLVEAFYAQDLQVRDIAAQLYLSPNYLSRVFKSHTQKTITDYIIEVRLNQAKFLLLERPDLKTYEVGQSVGYSDAVYFTKLFKRWIGMTPRQYRLQATL